MLNLDIKSKSISGGKTTKVHEYASKIREVRTNTREGGRGLNRHSSAHYKGLAYECSTNSY